MRGHGTISSNLWRACALLNGTTTGKDATECSRKRITSGFFMEKRTYDLKGKWKGIAIQVGWSYDNYFTKNFEKIQGRIARKRSREKMLRAPGGALEYTNLPGAWLWSSESKLITHIMKNI